ncbi:bifunctional protein-disulfide isomerase/oxidoreductase DsbC [Ferrimonas aestuarii]|uniref:Thiol:disulfide interchange protein n=1 Tax=Ferrimonas aestuarii TaxID=2569539 RepID=A0A4V5NVV8_9GAMM|nr:bifunctional protein-disulfide isomerase/oxidoreductase DsbC [Ferrimonas aestuarii]TKB53000.1 bifunctional protein-disulfide isomerase/oxidoreductase DsbC [Ferrimonas aestuarii]
MKTKMVTLLAALTMIATGAQAGEKEVISVLKSKVGFEVTEADISPSPVAGLYEVVTPQGLFYVSEDGSKLVHGQIYDINDSMKNLTETRMNGMRVAALEKVKGSAIEFKAPNEKHVVTVFTDISCGYCRKLHNEMQNYLDAGITIRYLAFPRGGERSAAWAQMEKLWCAADPKAAMGDAKAGEKLTNDSCDKAKAIAEHYQLGNLFGVNGTPAMVLEDGTLVPGYVPAERLQMQLGSR